MGLLLSPPDGLAEQLGLAPTSETLLVALTHSSYAAEHGCESNERLEFLGDAVVDLAVADLIITRYPELDEGSGSLVRSRVVNESSLARAARRLELNKYLRVGRGVYKENGAERSSLLADAFEAVVASVYLERGYDSARNFVQSVLQNDVASAALRPGDADPKTRLRQWSEANGDGEPDYVVHAEGPSHDVKFTAKVLVAGVEVASGLGRSKKAAEAKAAENALEGIDDA